MTDRNPDPRTWRFGRIETRAVQANGRIVTAWYSYPLGVGYDEYRRIDDALRRANGNDGSKTVGTHIDDVGKLPDEASQAVLETL